MGIILMKFDALIEYIEDLFNDTKTIPTEYCFQGQS